MKSNTIKCDTKVINKPHTEKNPNEPFGQPNINRME